MIRSTQGNRGPRRRRPGARRRAGRRLGVDQLRRRRQPVGRADLLDRAHRVHRLGYLNKKCTWVLDEALGQRRGRGRSAERQAQADQADRRRAGQLQAAARQGQPARPGGQGHHQRPEDPLPGPGRLERQRLRGRVVQARQDPGPPRRAAGHRGQEHQRDAVRTPRLRNRRLQHDHLLRRCSRSERDAEPRLGERLPPADRGRHQVDALDRARRRGPLRRASSIPRRSSCRGRSATIVSEMPVVTQTRFGPMATSSGEESGTGISVTSLLVRIIAATDPSSSPSCATHRHPEVIEAERDTSRVGPTSNDSGSASGLEGSTRLTVPSSVLATQIEPAPKAMPFGFAPTRKLLGVQSRDRGGSQTRSGRSPTDPCRRR